MRMPTCVQSSWATLCGEILAAGAPFGVVVKKEKMPRVKASSVSYGFCSPMPWITSRAVEHDRSRRADGKLLVMLAKVSARCGLVPAGLTQPACYCRPGEVRGGICKRREGRHRT